MLLRCIHYARFIVAATDAMPVWLVRFRFKVTYKFSSEVGAGLDVLGYEASQTDGGPGMHHART